MRPLSSDESLSYWTARALLAFINRGRRHCTENGRRELHFPLCLSEPLQSRLETVSHEVNPSGIVKKSNLLVISQSSDEFS